MIVGTAYQDSGFLQSDILYQLEILFAGPDPAGYFRKFISFFQTLVYRIPVLLAIKEKFTLPDLAVWTSQPVEIFVDPYDLFCAVGALDCCPSRKVVSVIQISSGMW